MAGRDIFISYCREERSAARHFAECFTAEGFSVWWDAVLRSGDTFDEVIEKELRAASAVVVLWSPRSVASRWVRAEATLADRASKLVPVIIESCTLPIIFELTHAADLADWDGDTSDTRWQTLVGDLRRLIGPPQAEGLAAADPGSSEGSDADRAKAVAFGSVAITPSPTPPKENPSERAGVLRNVSLLTPTSAESKETEFFKWSDEFRQAEGEFLHCLRRLDGEAVETVYPISPSGLTIGRSAPSDLIVAGAGVSRSHCQVELAADRLRVTDLNSTNGTYVDNKRVRSAILEVGSVLRVGNVSFEHEVRPRAAVQDEVGRDPTLGRASDRPEQARIVRPS